MWPSASPSGASANAELIRQTVAAQLRGGYDVSQPLPAEIDKLLQRLIDQEVDLLLRRLNSQEIHSEGATEDKRAGVSKRLSWKAHVRTLKRLSRKKVPAKRFARKKMPALELLP
jgi:hypothetical protein